MTVLDDYFTPPPAPHPARWSNWLPGVLIGLVLAAALIHYRM